MFRPKTQNSQICVIYANFQSLLLPDTDPTLAAKNDSPQDTEFQNLWYLLRIPLTFAARYWPHSNHKKCDPSTQNSQACDAYGAFHSLLPPDTELTLAIKSDSPHDTEFKNL